VRIRRFIIIGVCLLFVLIAAGLLFLDRNQLFSEDYQQEVIREVARKANLEVEVDEVRSRPLNAVELTNIRASNEHIEPKPFLTAGRLVLHYDWLEILLRRKIELKEVQIHQPRLDLNFHSAATVRTGESKPGTKSVPPTMELSPGSRTPQAPQGGNESAIVSLSPASPPPTSLPAPQGSNGEAMPHWPGPPVMELPKIRIQEAKVHMVLPAGDSLLFEEMNIRAAIAPDPVPSGTGTLESQTLHLPSDYLLRDVKLNFLWTRQAISFPRIQAALFGGTLEGGLTVSQSADASRIPLELELSAVGIDLQQWESHSSSRQVSSSTPKKGGSIDPALKPSIAGRLHLQFQAKGSLLEPLMASGLGRMHVAEGRLLNQPALVLVGGFLNRPEMRNLKLSRCEADIHMESGRIRFSNIDCLAADLKLSGQGWIDMVRSQQEFKLLLIASAGIARQLPDTFTKELKVRPDGAIEIPFRIWGSLSDPQNDLQQKIQSLASRAVGGAIFDRIYDAINKGKEGDKP
jgi:hypothetical protein